MRPLKPNRPEPPDPADPVACRRAAMDLLARREHARAELAAKLARRGWEAATVAGTLERLVGDGLLDEHRFVESFVSARLRRGQGPQRIRAELAERGVDDALIADGLSAADDDWLARAQAVREARFGTRLPADYREWARQARFLQYRGFTGEQIRRVLGDWSG